MLPVIALIGQPNVGKSTLFNCLTKTRQALVADEPGLTRDRQYGVIHDDNHNYLLIDTGGLIEHPQGMAALIAEQAEQAIQAAALVLFLVDAKRGLTPDEFIIADKLRKSNKPVLLVVNKCEGKETNLAAAEFHQLGFANWIGISAVHAEGIDELLTKIINAPSVKEAASLDVAPAAVSQGVKVALVGRPNVGKSTLINRLLGEERVVVSDIAGTTRDSIYIPFDYKGHTYTLIDTAGVRRRKNIDDKIEKFSIVKTLQAIEDANVVIMLLDAQENITDQDMHLLGFIAEQGKALVIAVNKWDNLPTEQRDFIEKELQRRLKFVDYAKIFFISALHGTNVGLLFKAVNQAYLAATKPITTPLINQVLEEALTTHQPPMSRGRRIKLRYAHLGGHNPPTIIIHGTQLKALPNSFLRFLEHYFRKALNLAGTPIRIILREGENPYKK